MLNFTVGPVQSSAAVLEIGAEQVPYFRTPEFSALMLESEQLMLEFADAPEGAKAIFITGSGTASMEAAIINTLTPADRAIVVNGGGFGQRFVDILTIHGIPHTEIKLPVGRSLCRKDLEHLEDGSYTAFLVNVHETSTGVLYDMPMIAEFCREQNLFLIADNISSFLADPFSMSELGADIMITGSQKALACPPGISVIVLSPRAVERVHQVKAKCMYLNLINALSNAERGQTPFTPAVGTLRQIHHRLMSIKAAGGVEAEIRRTAALAKYFRSQIESLPLVYVSESMSNAMTSLQTVNGSARQIFQVLKDEYGIWICPNGGELGEKIFRVGHIGELHEQDFDRLITAFKELLDRGILNF